MVKSTVGDETRLRSAEERLFQSGAGAEIGLVVGKLSSVSDRALVYDLVPTPPTDSGEPACVLRSEQKKKGSKGGKGSLEPTPLLVIDGDWVAEHSRQVSRMLLGGMYVIGAYVWASEASFKATSTSILSQTIRGIGQAASFFQSDSDEGLLIHISYSPRRWACQKCTIASGSLRPCEFKMSKLMASLQTFKCMYNFEMRIPVSKPEALRSDIKNVLCKRIASLAKDLQSAKALIDGHLASAHMMTGNQHVTSGGLHTVDLLLPYEKDPSIEACSSEDVDGIIVFAGVIYSSAYLGPKEPVSQAITDLQGDIINSLRSRLDIISDEAEGDADSTAIDGEEATGEISSEKPMHRLILNDLRNPFFLSFPRRVLVPWLCGTFICDYLQPSETFEDLKERCKEVMSMDASIDSSAIIEPETEAISATAKSFEDVVCGVSASLVNKSNSRQNVDSEKVSNEKKSSYINIPLAILMLLLAILFMGSLKVAY